MVTMSFVVAGNPVPKQSFKVKKGGGYTPQRIKDWQELVGWEAKKEMARMELPLFVGKVAIYTCFTLGHRRRVDDGNLSKAVDDGLNGVVWEDDSQVKFRITLMRYDKANPGIKVRVWELSDGFGEAVST